MAFSVNFVAINVYTINRDATVSVGEVNQPGWNANGKSMFGNAQVFGISLNANIFNNFMDQDIIDSPISDQDLIPSAQNQTA